MNASGAGAAARAAVALVAACGAASAARAAGTIDVSAYAWSALPSGSMYTRYAGYSTPTVGLRDDLAMTRHVNMGGSFTWRQTRRVVPNVTVEYVHMVSDGAVALRRNIQWEGTTYAVSGLLRSQANLKDGGIEVFWNAVSNAAIAVQTGFEMQWYSLHMPFAGTVSGQQPVAMTYTKEVTVGAVSWLPLIDARLAFHLPWHLNLYVKASYLPHRSDYIYDLRGGVSFRFDHGLSVFAGWRRFRLHIDKGDLTLSGDLEFRGAYTGIGYAF